MTKDQLLLSFDLLDEQYIEEAAPTAAKPKKRRVILTRAAACAVLLAILVPAILLVLPFLQTPITEPPVVYDPPTIFNALESPELLYGNGNPFVVGDTTEDGSDAEEPPNYAFHYSTHIARAEIVSILPDVYYSLHENDDVAPQAYRLIRFRTLEALNGNVPEEFFYLMPAWIVDYFPLDSFDTFLLSVDLLGHENYILRNETQNKLQALPLVLFTAEAPAAGYVIPFTDGIFNEQPRGYFNPPHIFGRPNQDLIKQGSTEEDTVMLIKELLNEIHSEYTPSKDILTYSTDFKTEEARAAFAYVQPFENGVFVQRIEPNKYIRDGHPMLIYTRYIGECQTEETITIDLETEEVFYSEVRYTEEELRTIVNISEYVARLRNQYAAQLPSPPHMDPEGTELKALNIFGRYVKIDGRIYGYIKTTWLYHEMRSIHYVSYDVPHKFYFYDDRYLLFDAQGLTVREVSRDELLEMTNGDSRYKYFLDIYWGDYEWKGVDYE